MLTPAKQINALDKYTNRLLKPADLALPAILACMTARVMYTISADMRRSLRAMGYRDIS